MFTRFEDAAVWLESFDPTTELRASIRTEGRKLSTLDAVLRSVSLQHRADQVMRAYQSLIGELLYRISTSALVSCQAIPSSCHN
jgi:hypothetical protein